MPARFRLHPHLACRLPYRFPRGRFTRRLRVRVPAPWLTDFPVVGWAWVSQHFGNSRGFPTDFPVVGLIGEMVGPNRTSGSLPIADFTVILLDAALAVGKREPRGLVRCTSFHAMYATRGEL